VSREYAFKKVK